MENPNHYSQTNSSMNDMTFSNEAQTHLKGAADWAKFIAILGLIVQGLAAMAILVSTVAIAVASVLPGTFLLILLMYSIILGIAIYMSLKLLGFASDCKKAIDSGDSYLLTIAMGKLKGYFTTMGILILSSFVLAILISIVTIMIQSSMRGSYMF